VSATDEFIDALSPVVAAFRALRIRYFVGGSVASSFHGAARATMDVDVIAELRDEHVSDFIEGIGTDFYVSEGAVREAVDSRTCFNVIHLPTSYKVDVFVSRERPFDREAMSRASTHRLGEQPSLEVSIASAEDSIISKLEWYQLTHESSERQWEDVSRLVHLLGDEVDTAYLQKAAESVGVSALLAKLLNQ